MVEMAAWKQQTSFFGAQVIYIGSQKKDAYQCPAKVSVLMHIYIVFG